MSIYLDILLAENCIVNIFLIYITSQTIRVKVKLKYIILSALLGSLYVLTMIFPTLNFFISFPFKIIVAVIMMIITFRKKDILFNFKVTAIFILYSMLLAGLCIFIKCNETPNMKFNMIICDFSYKKLIIALMIIYIFINRIVIYIKNRKEVVNLIYDIDIILNNCNKRVKAFLDTGNELIEPVTNLPVMIVEKEVFLDIDINKYPKFYIPYKVINGYNGRLQGFKPQSIKIYTGNKIENVEVIIALCENKFNNFNDYNALLSRGIIYK